MRQFLDFYDDIRGNPGFPLISFSREPDLRVSTHSRSDENVSDYSLVLDIRAVFKKNLSGVTDFLIAAFEEFHKRAFYNKVDILKVSDEVLSVSLLQLFFVLDSQVRVVFQIQAD